MEIYVCEVFDHVANKTICRGVDLEECNGKAYDKCMALMNSLPDENPYRQIPRYEFFCTEDSIDFQWRMNEEEFRDFRKDTEPQEEMGYLGAVFFGKYSLEFMHITDNCRYYNLFLLDEPGYDELIDGTPYLDCAQCEKLPIPERRTLEGFQRAIERGIFRMLCEYPDMIVDATSATEPERWYPRADGTYYSPTITRRA